MAQWFFNVPGKCHKDYHKYYTLASHPAKPRERECAVVKRTGCFHGGLGVWFQALTLYRTGYSCRGPEFDSQYLHGSLQPPVTLTSEGSMSFCDLYETTAHMCHTDRDRQICININKLFFIKKASH